MEITTVSELEFMTLCSPQLELTDTFTEEHFQKEWEVLQIALRTALGANWKEDHFGEADFAVQDDLNLAWSQGGAIFTQRIFSPEYVRIISNTLAESKRPDLWVYHTWCEIDPESDEPWNGEFAVKAGTLLLPDDGIDYFPVINELNT